MISEHKEKMSKNIYKEKPKINNIKYFKESHIIQITECCDVPACLMCDGC